MKAIQNDNPHATLDATIEALGLDYSARFVPFSQSRNKDEKTPSLNWIVTLQRGGHTITTDYMMGVGLIVPAYTGKDSYARRGMGRLTCETGLISRWGHGDRAYSTRQQQPAPLLRDVMHSLILDSDALDSPTYENWADNYGIDPDSRKGEATYRKCLSIALQLRAMLGDATLQQLREAFQEY